MNRNCSACNIKIDTNNYKKNRTVCKNFYNKNNRKNNNNNTSTQNQQPKTEIDNNKKKMKFVVPVNNKKKRKVVESVNNQTLIIEFSNCGKTCLMNHILYQKPEPIF